jgi:hypothetical protein
MTKSTTETVDGYFRLISHPITRINTNRINIKQISSQL